jgi:serine/threonine protein kinase
MIGAGGFGAVYRASASAMQHLPLAIKFCLDRSMLPGLKLERTNLERLSKTGTDAWSPFIVRLYGYDLEHPTPFLVYEYVPGGDLARRVAADRVATGATPDPPQVLSWIVAVTRGLAYAHAQGLVHRDLKPANVLLGTHNPKLADFGIGGVVSVHAVRHSRIGTVGADGLRSSEQASLFRGAGTPLYMSPEQRQGQPPDPRQDLFSLGVLWFQLLVGDVTRELHPGWADELKENHRIPRYQIDLIESCVGWIKKRPRDAGEVLDLLKAKTLSRVPMLELAPPQTPQAPLVAPLLAIPVVDEAVPALEEAVPVKRDSARKRALPVPGAKVRLRFAGFGGTANAELQVLCNGDLAGRGHLHYGFDIPVNLDVGRHLVVVKHRTRTGWADTTLNLVMSQPGTFEVGIVYRPREKCFAIEEVLQA